MKSYCEQAIEILQQTHDGNDLAPHHLSLLQDMVNANVWGVDERMEMAFGELYENVKSGYKKPWFHGIEHLTIKHNGYVQWKGIEVEHYNLPWGYSSEGRLAALELVRRCRILEARGEQVSTSSAIWLWEE